VSQVLLWLWDGDSSGALERTSVEGELQKSSVCAVSQVLLWDEDSSETQERERLPLEDGTRRLV
jgi:hypothetical protein